MGNFKLIKCGGSHRIKVCKSFDEPIPGPWRKPGKPPPMVGIKDKSAWGLGPKYWGSSYPGMPESGRKQWVACGATPVRNMS